MNDRSLTLCDVLKIHAQEQPQNTAYTFLGERTEQSTSLTFEQLYQAACNFSVQLSDVAKPGDRALLLYQPGLDYIVAFLGCLYAGVLAVPLYPPSSARRMDRLVAIIKDSDSHVALSTLATAKKIYTFGRQALDDLGVNLIGIKTEPSPPSFDTSSTNIGPDHLAFIQYTSGSTGDPKGVMVSHANLMHNSEMIAQAVDSTRDSVNVIWLPPYHDMGLIGGILQSLYTGYHAVLMSPASFLKSPDRWLRAISDYRGTHSGGPNFAYDLCVQRIAEEKRREFDLSSWKIAFNGAEPIRWETLKRFEEAFAPSGFSSKTFLPCYGLAESTLLVSAAGRNSDRAFLDVSAQALASRQINTREEDDVSRLVSTGKPFGDQVIEIIDPKTKQPCAVDQIGEICISGRSVAAGYWGRPSDTDAVFNVLIDGHDGLRFMRTGDLGFMHEGELFVTGRYKDLIIIRGRNYYPQDIENVVENSHYSLRPHGAAAFSIDERGQEFLVVVQELDYRQRPDLDHVLVSIRQAVAEATEVQPEAVVLIKPGTLPRTSSGKVRRARCRQQFLQEELQVVAIDRLSEESTQAANSQEQQLPDASAILESNDPDTRRERLESYLQHTLAIILNIPTERIITSSSLLSLGIDSLSAIGFAGRLSDDLGVEVPYSEFLAETTLDKLADKVEKEISGKSRDDVHKDNPIVLDERSSIPLSAGQQSLWFINRLAPEDTAYNVVFAARMVGNLDVLSFEKAVYALMERQPSLRTTFSMKDGEPVQCVHPFLEPDLEVINLSVSGRAQVDHYLAEQVHKPFNLSEGPLVRIKVFKCGDAEAFLQVVMHHIIVDFWSFVVLVHDLTSLYESIVTGKATTLQPLPATFVDYTYWQAKRLAGSVEPLRDYWVGQLQGMSPVTELPTDHPRPPVQSYNGASLPLEIPQPLTAQLKSLAKSQHVTLYTLLLSVFEVMVYRLTGQNDFIIGTPTAGRPLQQFADIVGYFVNPIPVRCRMESGQRFNSLLSDTRGVVLDGLAHAEYPFVQLVSDQLKERDPSRHPLFQSMFVLQKAHRLDDVGLAPFVLGERGAHAQVGGLAMESYPVEQRVSPFDLLVMMAEADDRLLASFQYNSDLYERSTIERFTACFARLLEQVVKIPDAVIDELEVVSDAERRQLDQWNATYASQPPRAIVHELFEEQVRNHPDAPALEAADTSLSYAELNFQANQLASCLRDLGAQSEITIGILADRSVEMIVAMLAVLKSNSAYLPLEPHSPKARLAMMLRDSNCPILLASRQHVKTANALQWEVDGLNDLLYIDADDPYVDIEQYDAEGDRDLWDYVAERAQDAIDASGWMNSYTGEYFTAEEMAEYSRNIVQKLEPFLGPDIRILEVGCGSGLSMFELAPRVAYYHGTDLSRRIIEKDREEARVRGLDNIRLEALAADRIVDIQADDFDIIIINSVVQLFPGHNYLRKVLRECVTKLKSRGMIFVGDVMDLDSREELVASLQEFAVAHAGDGYKTKVDWDRELFLSRAYFQDMECELSGVTNVEVTAKLGSIENELKRFRYDVILYVDKSAARTDDRPRSKRQIGMAAVAVFKEQEPPIESNQEGAAYVMYTSGSTGLPKGIAVPHKCVVRLVKNTNYVQLGHESRIAHLSNPAFDASTFEIWGALLNGGRVVLFDRDEVLDIDRFAELIAERRISTMFITTALFNRVAQNHPSAFSQLKELLVGGEVMDTRKVRRVLQTAAPGSLSNIYGPTECTTYSCAYPIGTVPDEHASVPVGKPLANAQLYVLDKNMRQVAIGVPGELYIGGLGVARGYVGKAALTAERFVPNPFSSTSGERLYRTGDLVRFDSKGNVVFLGRVDHQVKIRGFRVELPEIEKTLLQHSEVRETAVVALTGDSGEKKLTAYVAVHDQDAARVSDFRAFLKKSLPDYMVPVHFVMLDSMPLTKNGKVDRKSLPLPDVERRERDAEYSPPRTETEKRLASVWSEVLGVSGIGRNDNFFNLGGHSLMATQVVSRVRSAFAVELPLRFVFEHPRVAALASQIDQLSAGLQNSNLPPFVKMPPDVEVPLSFAQQRLWFLDQLQPGNPFYNVPGGIVLKGELNVEALRNSLSEIVQRHEVLRTGFISRDGQPKLCVFDEVPVPFQMIDLGFNKPISTRESLNEISLDEAKKPFNLADAPLLRATLVKIADKEHVLLLTMHHIVSDGWSIGVLVRELSCLYQSRMLNQPVDLDPLPLQYSDFAYWQRNWFEGEIRDQQIDYWKGKLEGAQEKLDLPTDYPRPHFQSFRGEKEPISIPENLTVKLSELANESGCTLFMVLLSGFYVLLHKISRQDDICIGTPIANRNHKEIENLIGFFVNTLVLRAAVSSGRTFHSLLEQVREVTLDAYAHQDLPFECVVEALNPDRDLSRSPLFQAMFVLQNTPDIELKLPGLEAERFDTDTHTAKFDLTLALTQDETGLSGYIEYNADLFDRATIQRWSKSLQLLLTAAAESPDREISELSLLDKTDLRQMLIDWNATAAPYSQDKCLHQIIEEQVERTPDAPALFYEEHTLSYRALNTRANRLAHRLRELGVGPDQAVAVCLDRSFELLVTMLGILKAGGYYVPLDPEYPRERLAIMLEDCRADVIVTHSQLIACLPENAAHQLLVDRQAGALESYSADNPAPLAQPQNLAYVIFTSGSTGRPKGVMIPHCGALNRLQQMWREYNFSTQDRFILKTPQGFDVSVWELFLPLMFGASTVIARPGGHKDPEYLQQVIGATGVSVIHFVPSMLNVFLAYGDPSALPSLKRVISSGEALPVEVVTRFYANLEATLENRYGPTEVSIDVTAWTCEHNAEHTSVPIGRPVANTSVYVLDEHLSPVAVGVPGELYLGGIGVARGYLNQPALSAERFVPDPFSGRAGERLYKTGDLVRYRSDGVLEYLGRLDHQVKVRGFRIELGEIEAALLQQPGVTEAVVLTHKSESGDVQIMAYLVSQVHSNQEVDRIRLSLKERLPEYMIPSHFMFVESIPLSPNGKVDRNKLLEMNVECAVYSERYTAPRNETEAVLAELWSEMLGVERVGIYDNFFHLGGHSLLATQIGARIRDRFAIEVPLLMLFERANIAELAQLVEQERSKQTTGARPEITRISREKRRVQLKANVPISKAIPERIKDVAID